ncbi:hypothetical protein HF521_002672 [Silurus meridionalis]|uniref:inositol-1,3,4-trisphosphate 5/6-kinase n=1 Tax=Silurus meridionalis TaxID=175797 RepID=A0A8T0B0K9_SILME|nr:hypothetical protein HF521_002672 [Silurus meridionalis]
MSLIFSQAGLRDIRPPGVLQSFVNHGVVLHKVFVVGEKHFTVDRPSLKNFSTGPHGKRFSFTAMRKVDEMMPGVPVPSNDAMVAMVKELRAELGMELFGMDIT